MTERQGQVVRFLEVSSTNAKQETDYTEVFIVLPVPQADAGIVP